MKSGGSIIVWAANQFRDCDARDGSEIKWLSILGVRKNPLITATPTRRQGAPLLTRFARSFTRRVACGQPVTAALRWDPSGLGQSRPIRPENDDVEPQSLYPRRQRRF
jgi:hypothetical protein